MMLALPVCNGRGQWHKERPFVFSLEISSHDLLMLLLAQVTGIPGVLRDLPSPL